MLSADAIAVAMSRADGVWAIVCDIALAITEAMSGAEGFDCRLDVCDCTSSSLIFSIDGGIIAGEDRGIWMYCRAWT